MCQKLGKRKKPKPFAPKEGSSKDRLGRPLDNQYSVHILTAFTNQRDVYHTDSLLRYPQTLQAAKRLRLDKLERYCERSHGTWY